MWAKKEAPPIKMQILCQLELKWSPIYMVKKFVYGMYGMDAKGNEIGKELLLAIEEIEKTIELIKDEDELEIQGRKLMEKRNDLEKMKLSNSKYWDLTDSNKKKLANWTMGRLGQKWNMSNSGDRVKPFSNLNDALRHREKHGGLISTVYKPMKISVDEWDEEMSSHEYYRNRDNREVGCYLVQQPTQRTEIVDGFQIIRLMILDEMQMKNYKMKAKCASYGLLSMSLKIDERTCLMMEGMGDHELPEEFAILKGDNLGQLHIKFQDNFPMRTAITLIRHREVFFTNMMRDLGVPYVPQDLDCLLETQEHDCVHCPRSDIDIKRNYEGLEHYRLPLHYTPIARGSNVDQDKHAIWLMEWMTASSYLSDHPLG